LAPKKNYGSTGRRNLEETQERPTTTGGVRKGPEKREDEIQKSVKGKKNRGSTQTQNCGASRTAQRGREKKENWARGRKNAKNEESMAVPCKGTCRVYKWENLQGKKPLNKE